MALSLEIVPQKALVVRRDKTIVAASWFGPWVPRPYVYPFLGPGDRELTRLGHPDDPVGHSHHRSIWIGHHDVGGVDFWGDHPRSGRIVQEGISDVKRSPEAVGALLACAWRSPDDRELLRESRRLTFHYAGRGELVLDLEISLEAAGEPVVLGKTNFGLLGIRVARTLRVQERLGGLIYNSQEAENEAGCFGQHAEWVDLSGPVPMPGSEDRGTDRERAPGAIAAAILGIACLDDPENLPGGTLWHVRDDGWMGPGISRAAARTIAPGKPLRARYRILAHAGRPWQAAVAERYRDWRNERARRGEAPSNDEKR